MNSKRKFISKSTRIMTTNCEPRSGAVDLTTELTNIPNIFSFSYEWYMGIPSRSSMQSSVFSNGTNKGIEWRLKKIPYADDDDLCIFQLGFLSSEINTIHCHCKFQVNAPYEKLGTWNKLLQCKEGKYSDCFEINLFNRTTRGPFNGTATVTCEILVKDTFKLQLPLPKCNLMDDLYRLCRNNKFSDVTLCASGKEFQAHKAILAARSPVFSAMFEHEMQEKNLNRVDITDIDGKVFEELLSFIYTGKVSNLEEYAIDLLPAAEKYGFETLKLHCEKALCRNISTVNAAEILVLSEMYNLHELKPIAIRYIGIHATDVRKTAGWNSIARSHPDLIADVLCDISQQFNKVFAVSFE